MFQYVFLYVLQAKITVFEHFSRRRGTIGARTLSAKHLLKCQALERSLVDVAVKRGSAWRRKSTLLKRVAAQARRSSAKPSFSNPNLPANDQCRTAFDQKRGWIFQMNLGASVGSVMTANNRALPLQVLATLSKLSCEQTKLRRARRAFCH